MTNPNETLLTINIPGLKKLRSGKVREIFDLGDRLLFLATDRISAFDVIMPTGIPLKGRVLTSISKFWFEKMAHIIPNHVLTTEFAGFPPELQSYRQQLEGRAMIVRKCKPLAVECIVRGYLAGSGWKEYKQSQSVCGVKLPSGLLESSELPEPIFTPSTKAESGHDINISQRQAAKVLGETLATRVHDASLAIYKWARAFARERGIIIADTKFEFGLLPDGEVILIDEVLTPDSSRFWPASEYQPGRGQPSFDKQFVRDYLETLDWDKTPPGPVLPAEIVAKTSEKYLEAYRRITGTELIS
ncbi:MAG: phosphoribosylaminoimidazolesuccinocarboxamide synthase [Verrucomicrobia bacterium]|nr:phosphoribosylaminoimidazolesuccinocarboxamide synthase [Verrucomicrobiota bacterium]